MKILLACQTATNKGDRAIAEYLIDSLVEQGHEVVLSTTRPDLWKNAEGKTKRIIKMGYRSVHDNVKNYFIKRCLRFASRYTLDKILYRNLISPKGKHRICQWVSKEFVNEVKNADLVIVTGGHHITSIRDKNALFSFTYDIGLVSLYAKRYILWSQTIGPLEFTSEKAKNFFEKTIRNAETVFIRDENSRVCIEETYGEMNNLKKTYDSVFGYGSLAFPDVSVREKKVGISIFDGLKKAFATYEVIAQMLDSYAADGYAIEFFRMEYNDFELENINRIIALMQQKADIRIHPFMTTTKEHLQEVASCRCFIGYKTHSVIMSLTTATPLVALVYHEKTKDFMNDFSLGDYALSDIGLEYNRVKECMIAVDENLEQIHCIQKNVAQQIAGQLKTDLLEMLEKGE